MQLTEEKQAVFNNLNYYLTEQHYQNIISNKYIPDNYILEIMIQDYIITEEYEKCRTIKNILDGKRN